MRQVTSIMLVLNMKCTTNVIQLPLQLIDSALRTNSALNQPNKRTSSGMLSSRAPKTPFSINLRHICGDTSSKGYKTEKCEWGLHGKISFAFVVLPLNLVLQLTYVPCPPFCIEQKHYVYTFIYIEGKSSLCHASLYICCKYNVTYSSTNKLELKIISHCICTKMTFSFAQIAMHCELLCYYLN